MAKIKKSKRSAYSISRFEVIGQDVKINSKIKEAIEKQILNKLNRKLIK